MSRTCSYYLVACRTLLIGLCWLVPSVQQWKRSFFQRLREHSTRVCVNHHDRKDEAMGPCDQPHGPMIIAFSGKRQFSWLFTPPLAKVRATLLVSCC